MSILVHGPNCLQSYACISKLEHFIQNFIQNELYNSHLNILLLGQRGSLMQKEAEKSRENPHFQAGIFHTLSRTTTVEHWDRTQIAAMRSKCLFTAHLGHLHKYIAHRHSPAYFVNDERCLFIQRRRKQLESVGARLIKNHAKKKKMVNGNFAKKVTHTPLTTPPPVPRPMLYMSTLFTDFIVNGQTYINQISFVILKISWGAPMIYAFIHTIKECT